MHKSNRFIRYAVTILATLVMISVAMIVQVSTRKEEKHIRIGYIYLADANNPYTYNFVKAQRLIEETYGEQVESFVEYNVLEGKEDEAIERLIAAGCDMIFGTSYGYGETLKEVAQKYPKIQFCAATLDNPTDPVVPNYHTFMDRVYEGRYISGIVAGLKLQELISQRKLSATDARIGYVAAFPHAEVISGYTAFYLGVKSIVPDATMKVKYTNAWSDYALEKRAASELIEEGCVVIAQHSDTYGPAVACEETTGDTLVYHVGYNQSMLEVAPTTSLVSCRINWSPYMVAAVGAVLADEEIEAVQEATTYVQDACAGFDHDWVQMLELNEVIVPPETRALVDQYVEAFRKHPHSIFVGDYQGQNPFDAEDVIDLSDGYEENASGSAPSFRYVLDDIVIE